MTRTKIFFILALITGVFFFWILSIIDNKIDQRIKADRERINASLEITIKNLEIQTDLDSKNYYGGNLIVKNGIETLGYGDEGFVRIGDIVLKEYETNISFDVNLFTEHFFHLAGKHPWGGRFYFHFYDESFGKGKKIDTDSRVAMEVYDWDSSGDGQIAIGFADSRIVLFPVPKEKLSKADMIKILDVRGSDMGLWGKGIVKRIE